MPEISRRRWLAAAGTLAGGSLVGDLAPLAADDRAAPSAAAASADPAAVRRRWRFCLNTSTIRGQQLSLVDEIELAARAGYDGIEPWLRELEQYVRDGGSLPDLKKRLDDRGLRVESAIGFAPWIVDDPSQRAAGLDQAKRDMELVRTIGGSLIAAPPAGGTMQTFPLPVVAERYGALLEVGRQMEVTPQIEVWGHSQALSRLGETVYAAIEAGSPRACILPDVFHLYKGGSDFHGLRLLSGQAVRVFHVNDYPAEPPRSAIRDADRVFPGDGVAPLATIFSDLAKIGFEGALSLELFNPGYWQRDAEQVVREGLAKTRDAVAAAFEA